MKLKLLIISLSLAACNNTKNPDKTVLTPIQINSTSNMDNGIFQKKVVIILSDSLQGSSNKINIQDYIVNGKSFIPVFTSVAEFERSTQGQVKNDKVEIDGILLLSILKGNETLRVNPGLSGEKDYKAEELIKKYTLEIADLNAKMKQENK